MDAKIEELITEANDARARAYCPYSKFHVGSAVLCEDDTIFSGSNVENASYGLTVCAERNAIFSAVCKGHRKFKAIAVCCDGLDTFQAPCGACRQVIAEFGLNWDLYMVKPDKTHRKVDFAKYLPEAFTPASLDSVVRQ